MFLNSTQIFILISCIINKSLKLRITPTMYCKIYSQKTQGLMNNNKFKKFFGAEKFLLIETNLINLTIELINIQ